MEIRIFAKGKPFTELQNNSSEKWLAEMTAETKRLIESGALTITELDVGNMKDYPTLLQRNALIVLKDTVQPQEACVLMIDEEKYTFTIMRYLNGYVVKEKYGLLPKSQIGVCNLTKESDAKKIEIEYFNAWQMYDITCDISWADHPEILKIVVKDDYLTVVMEKRAEFEAYLDTISPVSIDYATIFKTLKEMLGTKCIKVYTGEFQHGEGRGICGSTIYEKEEIERVYEPDIDYTLRYEYGEVTYKSKAGCVKFTKPAKTFGEFEIILSVTDYRGKEISTSDKLNELVKVATDKAKNFFDRVCKL